jgi:cytochrome c biogenesis protein CcmG, thiol:disulfide interchange protein DsbE
MITETHIDEPQSGMGSGGRGKDRAIIIESVPQYRHLGYLVLLAAALLNGCDRGDHPSQLSRKAPDFTIHDGTKTVKLDQYRGRVVVLNFWASWCAPCAEEFPSLIQLQQQLPGVVVLAVSFDEDADAYHQYVIDNHLSPITTVLDTSQQSNLAFGTTRPPETYIIDQQGVIRRKFIGAVDWTTPEIVHYIAHLSQTNQKTS